MNQREKILAAVLLCIAAAWGGKTLLQKHRDSVALHETELQNARQALQNANLSIASGRRAMRQLEKWQDLSLPTNRDVAHTLYHAWLLQKAKAAGLSVDDINPNERTAMSTSFQSIGYLIEARGTLSAVTKFLYEFYRSTQLQQITKLQLTANPGAPELRVQLQVEALILPGATHEDSLPDGKSDRLKLASISDYEKSIVGRDIFKIYTPPRPPSPPVVRAPPRPPAPKFDEASQAYVTGILGPPVNLQAWITVRTTGEVLRVHTGDDVKVGEFKGKVESISPLMIVIKTEDDKQLRVKLGNSLRDEEKERAESDEAAKPAEKQEDT
ncbi:MAG: hypothetical protein WD468_03580 [Pirellulales bacterium]